MKRRNIIILIAILVVMALVGYKIKHKSKSIQDFGISSTGAWHGKDSEQKHWFDKPLSENLYNFFKENNVKSVIDLGAGQGNYTKYFISKNIFTSCYDGNPDTQDLSDGTCAVINLSQPINFAKYDWVLSLEVGEHLPAEFEDILVSNLDRLNTKGVILSWAVPGQGGDGHVNERSNEYIKQKFLKLGYINDVEAEKKLREGELVWWFKNTIMVFRKPS